MSIDKIRSELHITAMDHMGEVSTSKRMNEVYPPWNEILSTHDVARLTRRPRWVIARLMWVRRFPRKRRFHGSGIGWLRSDVIRWLVKDLRAENCPAEEAP